MRNTKIMTKLKRNQKGITLIALVITIIVLLILAGVAISMLSGENGILKQAANAKTNTEKQNIIEQMKLAGIAALTAGNGSVEKDSYYTMLNKELKDLGYEGTITDLPKEEIEVKGEHFTIKANGEVVHLAWWYTGENKDKITNGKQTLTLGDTIDYNPIEGLTADANGVYKKYESKVEKNGYGTDSQIFELKNNTETTGQKLTWVVLGTDEDGNILIIPTTSIKDSSGTEQIFYIKGLTGKQYGANEVNNVASIYGYGKGAKSARSIQIEDIDKLTGFKKETFGLNEIKQYGNKVTYSWTEIQNEVSSVGSNGQTGSGTNGGYATNGFSWFDEATKSWKKSIQDISNPVTITTLTSTHYKYELTTEKCRNATLYNTMVTPKWNEGAYWLGSDCVVTSTHFAGGGVRTIGGTTVGSYYTMWQSTGLSSYGMCGVRPAVSLKSDITLVPNGANAWKIQ